jgi:hypothetical protein
MKKSKILFAVFMGMVALAMVSSCNKDGNVGTLNNESPYYLINGQKYFKATDETLIKLNLDRIELSCSENRTHDCSWSDNQYGSVNCNGGKCSILQTQNPNGSWSACIGCYINEVIDHAGACRGIN